MAKELSKNEMSKEHLSDEILEPKEHFNYDIKQMSNEQLEAQIDIITFFIKKSPSTDGMLNLLISEAIKRGMNIKIVDIKGDTNLVKDILDFVQNNRRDK